MQTSNRILDDLAKVASGAASTVVGVKQEIDALLRQRLERLMNDFDLVTRDEFEAVRATAANARAAQERLEQRVAELEARLKDKRTKKSAAQAGDNTNDPSQSSQSHDREAPNDSEGPAGG
ncbi:MAG: accessory factor UbiK family protein [Hyphomicrobiales bacterium]|nr:accessory factor UbiK family protein [Hyphomicrobiales bacterium]